MIQSISKAVRQVVSKIWPNKKYNRINWQNRPSTATALGATNLNKIDVFCNDVDNALIQMDAGKLNIETANSMLASVSFDSETGKFTFKELDGTTYEYDLNLEKIPVSFTLSEDGILTMTTEDDTQWTCNIADLIKDYVFDDSDTITFEKEFVEEDDEGKGSYHVTASIKAGSINETHLNPDYRSDILTYTTQAQTAANDSLTYSKDSKRWAVGDAEYEGSATDNAKYYKEQAEAAKQAAEEARDEAQAATGAVIATTTQLGVVKPDGTTIGVEEDGTIKSIIKAASLLITDNQELVVEKQGEVAQETTTQALIDAIADKVANQLVTNTALTSQLANYVTKAMMSNVQVNDQNKVPTSSLAFSMNQAITELNSDLSERLIMLPDGATAIQSKTGNTLRRLQMQAVNDDISYFKSDDGGQTWPVSKKLITNADLRDIFSGRDNYIDTLSSIQQLTTPGFYKIDNISSAVNDNAGSNPLSDYATGDFYGLLMGESMNSTNGCCYGTLILTSPRLAGDLWVGNIWDYKFAGWYKK